MEQSFVAPRSRILLYHRFPATLLKPGLRGKPMVKAKHRYYAKWRYTALSVGFLTIISVASALAQGSEYIYWVESGSFKIRRADLDGTNPVDHITGVNGVSLGNRAGCEQQPYLLGPIRHWEDPSRRSGRY